MDILEFQNFLEKNGVSEKDISELIGNMENIHDENLRENFHEIQLRLLKEKEKNETNPIKKAAITASIISFKIDNDLY